MLNLFKTANGEWVLGSIPTLSAVFVTQYFSFTSNSTWNNFSNLQIFFFQLFYLVTELYKEGNAKEMKKWAYEIHSSFLVPGAPLRLNNVDENFAREIDEVLLKESDKEEILRKVPILLLIHYYF